MKRDRPALLALLLLFLLLESPLIAAVKYPVKAITPSVSMVEGPVNGVLIEQRGHTLAIYGDPRDNPAAVRKVLFTHHRRDVVWAGRALVERGAEAIVPAGEEQLFTGVRQFWEKFQTARFHDYSQQSTKILAEPFKQVQTVRGGSAIDWEGLTIHVLDTPGYTRGAVSYLFELDGKRIACVGDLIYGDGRILDLYSLQDAIPEAKEDGYHGYAARAADLIRSLQKIAEWKPDVLIPARGPAIGTRGNRRGDRRGDRPPGLSGQARGDRPPGLSGQARGDRPPGLSGQARGDRPPGLSGQAGTPVTTAIDKLSQRLQAVFISYFSIEALRWYRGDDRLRLQAARVLGQAPVDWMPMAGQEKNPDWVIPIGNSRMIVSQSGAAFLVDCGNLRILQEVKKLQQEGRFKTLDAVYITHYHDDHTNQAQAAADEFHCPVFACAEMRDILEHPGAYRMPALTANPIRSVKVMEEGAKRRWNEFEFTYSYFPGQTLYHGGLVVSRAVPPRGTSERSGATAPETVFFIGDSFTPSGIDDYCLLNRNFLAPERGFLYCLRILKKMQPSYLLVNEHVEPPFRFSPRQIDLMIETLGKRATLMRDLFPWDDANFGLDEQWARFYPYGLEARAGGQAMLKVAILNHSGVKREYRVTPRVPSGWKAPSGPLHISIGPREEGFVSIPVTPPPDARGLAIITADIAFGAWDLREWVEAMVIVGSRQ